ncbi:hypothetical protein GOP47_0018849 [Adiantum capillus-veneris]|uniref:Uncharacterized protein n=1 Tax=Adiantum capillus-veneris TaxID=13818 RepID=A0A9D4UEB3_ADICA|nr:hypothetical protein GOP47_0018849 [Adiantum capillus-veneris]
MEGPNNNAESRTYRGSASMQRSMPLLTEDSISQLERAVRERIWMDVAKFQGQPQYKHSTDYEDSQSQPSASHSQAFMADGLHGKPRTQLCNFIPHGPSSSNSNLPSCNLVPPFSRPSREHETSSNDRGLSQTFEANQFPAYQNDDAHWKASRQSSFQICPPGFGNVAKAVDTSPLPAHGSLMKKSVSLSALDRIVSSGITANTRPSSIDWTEMPFNKLGVSFPGTGVQHSMPRSGSVGSVGAEEFSVERIPSVTTSAGQESAMMSSPSTDIFTCDFSQLERSPSTEEFGRLSFVGTSDIGNVMNESGCQLPTMRTSPSNYMFKDFASLRKSCSDENLRRLSSSVRRSDSTLLPQQPRKLRTILEVCSDDETSLEGQESMMRSPGSSVSSQRFLLNKRFIDENFRGFSVKNMLFSQEPEQLRTIPKLTTDGAVLEPDLMEPQKLHAFDHKHSASCTSSSLAEKPVVYPGTAQELGFNTPQGLPLGSHDITELFARVRQKRLELQELEKTLLSHVAELYQSHPRVSEMYRSMPVHTNTLQPETCGAVCRYDALGKCNKGNTCSFLHLQENATTDSIMSASSTYNPRLSNYSSFFDIRQMGWTDADLRHCHLDAKTMSMDSHHQKPLVEISRTLSPKLEATSSLQSLDCGQGIIKNLDDYQGQYMCIAAKDPHLSRTLQAKLVQGNPKDVEKIFEEIMKGDVVELAMDPYANYLVQKLLEVSSSVQYKSMLQAFLKDDSLVNMSLNVHGTRVVQKVIARLAETPNQRRLMISSLHQDTVKLSKDPSGSHVVQKCLQHLRHEDCLQLMYDTIISSSEEIATDRYGCLVLQHCLEFGSRPQTQQLVDAISASAVALSLHPFGNYVVQHVFRLDLAWASKAVIFKLKGKFAELAVQKCSSNVVEKCLKVADEEDQAGIVKELMEPSVFHMLLDHPFANYVIQSALEVTQGSLHTSLVQAILPRVPELRNSTYGRRILSCSHLANSPSL